MWEKHKTIKYAKNILITLLYIIIIPIILYDMFLIIQTWVSPNSTPNMFGIKTFSIISGSMEPTIKKNDIVIVKKVQQSEIKTNDIITFNLENEIVTHRVIKIEKIDGQIIYTTKGDSNEVSDLRKIQYNQIEGKYIGKISKVGKLFTLLKNKIIFGIVLFVLVICYMWQRKSIAKKVERKKKREKYERKKRLE